MSPDPIATLNSQEVIIWTDDERNKIDRYKSRITLKDRNDIFQYGTVLQNQMVSFSDTILRQISTKDMGEISDTLTGLINDLKTFNKMVNGGGFLDFFRSRKKKIIHIRTEYTRVERNVIKVEQLLEKHYQALLKDIHIFDRLAEQNGQHYRNLSMYIQAAEEKLEEARLVLLSGDAPAGFEQQIHMLERKLTDLRLSRMVSMQLVPQIRLVQTNSTTLMHKVQSGIVNILPLWRNHMVLALGLVHSKQSLDVQQTLHDATNEALRRNSKAIRKSSIKIARANEKTTIDMGTLRKANADLFAAISEVLDVQEKGRRKRMDAEIELRNAENRIRSGLME